MLPSRITTVAQTSVFPAGSMALSTFSLRQSGSIARKPRTCQQRRSFRFGPWSSYLDPSLQKELQHRHRLMKHKYTEAVNRKLWDRQVPDYAKDLGFKNFMCSARLRGRWPTSTSSGMNSEQDSHKDTGNAVDQPKPQRDATTPAYRHFDPGYKIKYEMEFPFERVKETVTTNSRGGEHSRLASQSNHSSSQEYEIDPITNRKVFKNPTNEHMGGLETLARIRNSLAFAERCQKSRLKHQKAPHGNDPVHEGLKSYDSKTAYDQPFMAYEPDGQTPEPKRPISDPVEEGLKAFDSKVSYSEPFLAYEPDGKRPSSEKTDPVQEGLKTFDAKMSYDKPYLAHEPDGQPPMAPKTDPVQEGLKSYDAKMAYDKPHMAGPDEISKNERNSKPLWESIANSGSDKQTSVVNSDPARESLKAYERRHPYPESQVTPQTNATEKAVGLRMHDSKHSFEPADYNVPFGRSSASSRSFRDSTASNLLGKKNTHMNEALKRTADISSRQKLTGNFVRDFPEEFEQKWAPENGTLVPDAAEKTQGKTTNSFSQAQQSREIKIQGAEKACIEGLASKESFSKRPNTPRIQTSLERGNPRTSTLKDDAKPVPNQGEGDLSELVSSYGRQNASAAKSEKTTSNVGSTQDVKSKPEVQVTTVYKVLAYDPIMQSVSVAETTSIVPDSASPLTPAEVLLRLSNPAKFFSHFGHLQSQGYEIISGSGDVLIFRKVRDAKPTPELKKSTRNPIDGMQGTPIAATGNFASPTGFVNHDLPPRTDPAYKTDNLRREEPLLNEKRKWYRTRDEYGREILLPRSEHSEARSSRQGRGRRMVAYGLSFGACAYAVGVVSEFFKTGGKDGKGPQGL